MVTLALPTPGLSDTADPLASARPNAVGGANPLSEKARGKQRATSPLSSPPIASDAATIAAAAATAELDLVPDDELLRLAAAGVGPNGHVPTAGWVASWQKGLPLDPVLVAISELLPLIQEKTPRAGAPSQKVFRVLKEAEIKDVLPPPGPVVPRKFHVSPVPSSLSALCCSHLDLATCFVLQCVRTPQAQARAQADASQWSAASQTWLTSLLWGDIYVAGITSVGIWKDTHVRLFGVKTQPQREARGVGKVLRYMGVPV